MPATFLRNYLQSLNSILSSLSGGEFEEFIGELRSALEREANIFICGNGGSAANASHFTCDINKGVSYGNGKRFKVICLSDNIPLIMAYANDVSFTDIFVEQLKNFMQKDDIVIGVSGSGNSANVIRAVEYACQRGVRTFAICGFDGGRLNEVADKSLMIRSHDMQKVEDSHLIIFHAAMQCLSRTHMSTELRSSRGRDESTKRLVSQSYEL